MIRYWWANANAFTRIVKFSFCLKKYSSFVYNRYKWLVPEIFWIFKIRLQISRNLYLSMMQKLCKMIVCYNLCMENKTFSPSPPQKKSLLDIDEILIINRLRFLVSCVKIACYNSVLCHYLSKWEIARQVFIRIVNFPFCLKKIVQFLCLQ